MHYKILLFRSRENLLVRHGFFAIRKRKVHAIFACRRRIKSPCAVFRLIDYLSSDNGIEINASIGNHLNMAIDLVRNFRSRIIKHHAERATVLFDLRGSNLVKGFLTAAGASLAGAALDSGRRTIRLDGRTTLDNSRGTIRLDGRTALCIARSRRRFARTRRNNRRTGLSNGAARNCAELIFRFEGHIARHVSQFALPTGKALVAYFLRDISRTSHVFTVQDRFYLFGRHAIIINIDKRHRIFAGLIFSRNIQLAGHMAKIRVPTDKAQIIHFFRNIRSGRGLAMFNRFRLFNVRHSFIIHVHKPDRINASLIFGRNSQIVGYLAIVCIPAIKALAVIGLRDIIVTRRRCRLVVFNRLRFFAWRSILFKIGKRHCIFANFRICTDSHLTRHIGIVIRIFAPTCKA